MKKYVCNVHEPTRGNADVREDSNEWFDTETNEPITGEVFVDFGSDSNNYTGHFKDGLRHNPFGFSDVCLDSENNSFCLEGRRIAWNKKNLLV